ncbi:hypothetical protein BD289DRAFT_242174, partial [Coniella lustricola]
SSSSSSSSSGNGAKPDTWACRHSVHADAPRRGTASWAEFEHWVRDEHAASEEAFTPGVVGHRVLVEWDRQEVASVVVDGSGGGAAAGTRWRGLRILLVEMKHKLPPPLQPRVFSVVQVICSAVSGGGDGREARDKEREEEEDKEEEEEAFLVISIPMADWPPTANASADWAVAATSSGCLAADKDIVVGMYASVEKVTRRGRRRSGGGGGERMIDWTMATTSDACGVLPLWVQTKAVPGQIAKDVGLFLGWVAGERERGKGATSE